MGQVETTHMADPLFLKVRRGATLRVIEDPDGDTSDVNGNPVAYIIEANTRGTEPKAGATPIALTVTFDGTRWIMTLLDTSGLTASTYLFYSEYSLNDGSTYIPEPTLVVVKG